MEPGRVCGPVLLCDLGRRRSSDALTSRSIGLRNLTGVIDVLSGTVTSYATTSTSSVATDNGADPNKVVAITDALATTTSET